VFSATHTGGRSRATHARSHPNTLGRSHILAVGRILAAGRSRATHARSHPNTLGRRHILAAKPRALRNSPTPLGLRRQELAPRRLAVLYKPGLHRPAVPCTPVGAPALRTHRQVPPNQRPVLRSRPGPMRWPLKMPKRLRRERELYSSPISLVVLVCTDVAPLHLTRTEQVGSRRGAIYTMEYQTIRAAHGHARIFTI